MSTKKTLDISGDRVRSKKKVANIHENPVKKRKVPRKSPDGALVVAGPKKISKLEGGLTSIMGDSVDAIQALLESNNNESATTLMQKRMLQTIVDILPYAESNIRSSHGQRGVHAFNSLVTSLREVLIDIQSTRDKGDLGANMVERVVRPAFMDIGMILVQEDARLDNEIKDFVDLRTYEKIKAAKKESLSRVAVTINDKYREAKEQAIAFMQT